MNRKVSIALSVLAIGVSVGSLISFFIKLPIIRYVDKIVEKEIVRTEYLPIATEPLLDFVPIHPVKQTSYLTSVYGYRKSVPNTGGNAGGDIFHNGLDFGVTKDMLTKKVDVIAVADGTIVEVWHSPLTRTNSGAFYKGHRVYGGMVRIRHDNSYTTLYGHLDWVFVNETTNGKPTTIKQGDVIGLMGNTGLSSGKHLHFSIEVDPRKYFE